MTTAQLSMVFFLQMAVILAACRGVGWIAQRLGQPQVVGEMVAGVMLGPSLLGLLWPEAQTFIFPPETLKNLYVGAQLGVGLYMFLVGCEFKAELFKKHSGSAASISIAGMAVPFAVGAVLALWLFEIEGLFSPKLEKAEAMLFMGACIAITAFPMLARIIYERGLTGTSMGTLALAAGAVDDAVAWCVLAVVLAMFGGGPMLAVMAVGGGALYSVFMMLVAPKLLAPLGRWVEREGHMNHTVLGLVMLLLMLAAWAMDVIGIHAVFGGFLLGIAMPRGKLTEELKRQLEPFAVVFLLPMFFTYSGLNTRLDMVDSMQLLMVALVVLAASTLAKGGACWAAARLGGLDNRSAMGIGALMNARGLMELIILNIGLQKGLIYAPLFSIMVLMAIVTTLMATPLFIWSQRQRPDARVTA
jgi:Kef-type K+ transport system membrane component KefB